MYNTYIIYTAMGCIKSTPYVKNELNDVKCKIPDYSSYNKNNTSKYTPNFKWCKIVNIYDGDTVTVVGGDPNINSVYKYSVRLLGIDAPEKRTTNEDEKKYAMRAKTWIEEKLTETKDNIVYIDINKSSDKYGRLLAKLYINNICINDELLKLKYVVPYDGNTKLSWKKMKKLLKPL